MKRHNNVLQLLFRASDGTISTGRIQQKILELRAKEAAIEEDCQKLHPVHTKFFIYFEQKSLDKQIELLHWILYG